MKKPWKDILHNHTYELDFARRDNDTVAKPCLKSSLPIEDKIRKRMVDDLPTRLKRPIRVSATGNYLDDHASTIEVRVAGSDKPIVGNYVITESADASDHLILIRIDKVDDKGGVQEIGYVPWTEIRSIHFHQQCHEY